MGKIQKIDTIIETLIFSALSLGIINNFFMLCESYKKQIKKELKKEIEEETEEKIKHDKFEKETEEL